MAIALAQTSIDGVTISGSTLAGTFGSNTTTGHTIIAVVNSFFSGAQSVSSIAISTGAATFSPIIAVVGNVNVACLEIWAAPNITGGTTPKVTATCAHGVAGGDIYLYEFSGMPTTTTQDGTAASSSATTNNAMVAPAITTTGSNTVIFSAFSPFGTGSAAEAGWQSIVGSNAHGISQYIIETSTQTALVATATQTGGTGGAYFSVVAGFAGTVVGSVPSESVNHLIYCP